MNPVDYTKQRRKISLTVNDIEMESWQKNESIGLL